jgi:hypothetical protein
MVPGQHQQQQEGTGQEGALAGQRSCSMENQGDSAFEVQKSLCLK